MSVLNYLATHASPTESELITQTLTDLEKDPDNGYPVPFDVPGLENYYVVSTPDKRWSVLFIHEPGSAQLPEIVRVFREEDYP